MANYTEQDWDAQCFDVFGLGAELPTCPECQRKGFYGPRFAEPSRKYHACRFCGFHQDVGQGQLQYRPSVHGCKNWPTVAGAPYIWWVAPDQRFYTCPWCKEEVEVRATLVANPAADRDHPWWKVRQNLRPQYFRRYWAQWPTTMGRLYL